MSHNNVYLHDMLVYVGLKVVSTVSVKVTEVNVNAGS